MGNPVQYYQFPRPEVLAIVPESASRILDVGCGAGALGASLKTRQACEVTGVEFVAEAAELARGALDRVLQGDLFTLADQLVDGYYDAIILADVLEHLPDTDQALQLLSTKLAVNGALILSLPNTRHWSVLRSLLEGDWKYEDAGLLDRTHLRFFTHRSLIRSLASNGFFPRSTTSTRYPHLGQAPSGLAELLATAGIRAGNLLDETGDYQYLLVCQKMDDWAAVEAPTDPLQARSIFYLAEFCREIGDAKQAMSLYSIRSQYLGQDEERWFSSLQQAALMESLGYPRADVLYAYWQAYQTRPTRAEPLVALARLYREGNEFALAHLCAKKAMDLPYPSRDTGYIDADCYRWKAMDEFAIASYWVGHFADAQQVCESLLQGRHLPEQQRERIRSNLEYSVRELKKRG
jgi:2-polyprenyl-3-methyl-5-hydroxy-6-metoxy-1,4-benzoquinol methylase